MKKIILFISAIFLFTFIVKASFAKAQYLTYPITTLGNCQNATECFHFCQIPSHTPACWAYGEYVLKPDILGEQTVSPEEEAKAHGVTFPIAELGNCSNPKDCFAYCDKPENQDACFAFAKKKNLLKESDANQPPPSEILTSAKTELGCTSRESCQTLCENPQNNQICRKFAENHKLNKTSESRQNKGPRPEEVLKKAQSQLGCSSENECKSFCADPYNSSKCLEFARKNKLLDPEKEQEIEEIETKKTRMMDDAEKELGCSSMESCLEFCSQTQNRQKCEELAKKHNPENEKQSKKQDTQLQNTKPCTSEDECKKYCQTHPNECPGFKDKKPEESKSSSSLSTKPADKIGDFIGPSGCKTEGECRSYCQKHPSECPNLPVSQITPKLSPVPSNKPERNNTSQTGKDQKAQNTQTPMRDADFNTEKNKQIENPKPEKFEIEKH